jgi:hypothetical protein
VQPVKGIMPLRKGDYAALPSSRVASLGLDEWSLRPS